MSNSPALGAPPDGVERGPHPALVVAGASRGFTVLLIGGAVQPWVGVLVPTVGYFWLALVAVAAFAWAARPRLVRGAAPSDLRGDRVVVGVAAALGAYALVLPLVLMAAGDVPWVQVGCTAATAVVVGATVGAAGRRPAI